MHMRQDEFAAFAKNWESSEKVKRAQEIAQLKRGVDSNDKKPYATKENSRFM